MLLRTISTVDKIMKERPLLVLLLFAASAVILAGMYYGATRGGEENRQEKWTETLADLDACSHRKHVKSAQYGHFAEVARQERQHDAERLFRAMAHAEGLQEYNCAKAIVRLGGHYAPPKKVSVMPGSTADNLRRSIDSLRRTAGGGNAAEIDRALEKGNRYAARVLVWARAAEMRHLELMEICHHRLTTGEGSAERTHKADSIMPGAANRSADSGTTGTKKGTANGPTAGYLVCPTCGNIYPAAYSNPYCPACLTDGRRFILF